MSIMENQRDHVAAGGHCALGMLSPRMTYCDGVGLYPTTSTRSISPSSSSSCGSSSVMSRATTGRRQRSRFDEPTDVLLVAGRNRRGQAVTSSQLHRRSLRRRWKSKKFWTILVIGVVVVVTVPVALISFGVFHSFKYYDS